MSPTASGLGVPELYRTISPTDFAVAMTSPSPGRLPDGGRPAASQFATVLLRRTRCGALGQPTSNRPSKWVVSFSVAARRRCWYSGWIATSSLARNRVPIHTPETPSVSAAASPRPSAMPPAAMTGISPTASTTAGMSGIVATLPRTWPPASQPWATTISTPQSTARRASLAFPTVCMTTAPPAFARETSGEGSRQKNEMTGTPSSKHASSRSSCGNSMFKFTANGLDVSERVSRTCRRKFSSSMRHNARVPNPPALLTAAARRGPTAPAIGAWTMGTSIPRRSQTQGSSALSI